MEIGEPADDGRRSVSANDRSLSEQSPSLDAGSLILYIHQEPAGVRVLTGGGVTADGICADIFAKVRPGGAWNGVPCEELLPGRYQILGNRLMHADGHVVLVGG